MLMQFGAGKITESGIDMGTTVEGIHDKADEDKSTETDFEAGGGEQGGRVKGEAGINSEAGGVTDGEVGVDKQTDGEANGETSK